MNEQLIIDSNNFLQKLTENVVKPMYGIRDKNSIQLISQSLNQEVFGVQLYPTIFDKVAYLWYVLSNYHLNNRLQLFKYTNKDMNLKLENSEQVYSAAFDMPTNSNSSRSFPK